MILEIVPPSWLALNHDLLPKKWHFLTAPHASVDRGLCKPAQGTADSFCDMREKNNHCTCFHFWVGQNGGCALNQYIVMIFFWCKKTTLEKHRFYDSLLIIEACTLKNVPMFSELWITTQNWMWKKKVWSRDRRDWRCRLAEIWKTCFKKRAAIVRRGSEMTPSCDAWGAGGSTVGAQKRLKKSVVQKKCLFG